MSDDFIPLNQSTPVQGRWQARHNNQNQQRNNHSYQNNRFQRRGGFNNRRGNNSQKNSSYGSDSNSSYGQDNRNNIDAYLHPSMLQDPWEHLRKNSS